MNLINIIIVNYHSFDEVIYHIKKFSCISGFKLYIVDNSGEFDNYESNENITIFHFEENLGYAKGNNKAYENIDSGYLLILNPDVSIEVEAIRDMASYLHKNKTVGQVFCSAIDENDNKLYEYITLKGLRQSWYMSKGNQSFINSDYAAGSAFMLDPKRLTLDYLFDEDYFLYWEEVDLSLRIRKQGLDIKSYVDIPCIRRTNSMQSKSNAIYYLTRNSFLINKSHNMATNHQHFIYLISILKQSLFLSFECKNFTALFNFFYGCYDALKNKKGIRK